MDESSTSPHPQSSPDRVRAILDEFSLLGENYLNLRTYPYFPWEIVGSESPALDIHNDPDQTARSAIQTLNLQDFITSPPPDTAESPIHMNFNFPPRPENLPPIPHGYVFIGHGPIQTGGERYRCAYIQEDGLDEWRYEEHVSGDHIPYWFCAHESETRIIELNQAARLFYETGCPIPNPNDFPIPPSNMPPLPEGVILIGHGSQIINGDEEEVGLYTWTPYDTTNGWVEETSSDWRNEDFWFAALSDEYDWLQEENREMIDFYEALLNFQNQNPANPRPIQHGEPPVPTRAPRNVRLPTERFPWNTLPEGAVLLGMRGTFVVSEDSFRGYFKPATATDQPWRPYEDLTGVMPGWYAVAADSRLARENPQNVHFYHGHGRPFPMPDGFDFPAEAAAPRNTQEQNPTPPREDTVVNPSSPTPPPTDQGAPAPTTPRLRRPQDWPEGFCFIQPPEGFVIIGDRQFRVGDGSPEEYDNQDYYTLARRQRIWRRGQAPLGHYEIIENTLYAVRRGSRTALENADAVAVLNPWPYQEEAVDTAPQFPPCPIDIPPPEGFVIIGNGPFEGLERRGLSSWIAERGSRNGIHEGSWTEPSSDFTANLARPTDWFAVPRTHPIVTERAAQVAFYNPTTPVVGQNPPPERPRFEGPMPGGNMVIIGYGPHHHTRAYGGVWREGANDWLMGFTVGHLPNAWHCISIESSEAAQFAEEIAFYNPNLFPEYPFEDELPEGYVLVGKGPLPSSVARPGLGICRLNVSPYEWGSVPITLQGDDTNTWYAFPADSPEARQMPIQVAFYRLYGPKTPSSPQEESPTQTEERSESFDYFITFNGSPISTRKELDETLQPLFLNEANFVEVTQKIWDAQKYEDPDQAIIHLIDIEPVVSGSISYVPRPKANITVSPAAAVITPIQDVVTKAAAGALLANGMGDHFMFTEDRTLVINSENPPSIDQGYEMIRRALGIKESGTRLDNFSSWALGMLMDEMDRYFGDDFDVSQVAAQTDRVYNTLICALGVFRRFGANRRNLSYTHHKEAYYSKTSPEQMDFILNLAERLKLTVAQMRVLSSHVKAYGHEALEEMDESDLPDAQTLLERLDVRSTNKNWIFQYQGNWHVYRGPYESLPNGAAPVFNADTRQRADETPERPVTLTTWVVPGQQVPSPRGHAAVLERNREAARESGGEVARSTGGNTHRDIPAEDIVLPASNEEVVVADNAVFTATFETQPDLLDPTSHEEEDEEEEEAIFDEHEEGAF